jgi:hypothetical protein
MTLIAIHLGLTLVNNGTFRIAPISASKLMPEAVRMPSQVSSLTERGKDGEYQPCIDFTFIRPDLCSEQVFSNTGA